MNGGIWGDNVLHFLRRSIMWNAILFQRTRTIRICTYLFNRHRTIKRSQDKVRQTCFMQNDQEAKKKKKKHNDKTISDSLWLLLRSQRFVSHVSLLPSKSIRRRSEPQLYLFDQFDRWLQIHTKINKCPWYTLSLVLFLLQDEHVMIEVLLKLFVRKVDAQLLETVELPPSRLKSRDGEAHTQTERKRKRTLG